MSSVPSAYLKYYKAAAAQYGVPESVLEGQDQIESGFDPGAVSPTNAQGISQFEPGTAKEYHVQYGTSPQAVKSQILGQAAYDAALGFGKDPRHALASYNAGPGNYQAGLSYADKVLAAAKQFGGLGGGVSIPGMADVGNPDVQGAPTPEVPTTPAVNLFSALGGVEKARNKVSGQSDSPLTEGWDELSKLYNQSYANNANQINQQIQQTNSMMGGVTPTSSTTNHAIASGLGGLTKIRGVTTFGGHPVAGWIAPILAYAKAHGWGGSVTSGYRTDAEQTRIYNSGVRPAALPKSLGGAGSNHEGSSFPLGAVDVSEAAQLAKIIANSPYKGLLVWAGSKDPVHFSHPHGGGY